MTGKEHEQLKIDVEFKNLIRPLSREEYAQLESSLVIDGCRDPIIIWGGTIIDGHDQYEICNRLHIPFIIQEMAFDERKDAIGWICENQLNHRNLSEETRKYLIGRLYEAEKIVGYPRKTDDHKQYSKLQNPESNSSSDELASKEPQESRRRTATRIGAKYHIAFGTVQKYGKHSRAVDILWEKMPELVPKILSGNYRISHENIEALSEMDANEMKRIASRMGLGSVSHIRYNESRKNFPNEQPQKTSTAKSTNISAIKTMPAYDPDALAKGLTFTIPSWAGSMERTRIKGDLNNVSSEAKRKLKEALWFLHGEIQALLAAIKEEI